MIDKGMTTGSFDPALVTDIELPFGEGEYRARLKRTREIMAREGIDLLYVTTPEAVCYLHGYFTSWYKANAPMRYPQVYGTALHVDRDDFILFDNPTEIPIIARTSISRDNRYFNSREAKPNIVFVMDELAREGWLGGTVGLEYWSYVPNRAVSEMIEAAFRERGCEVVDASTITREVRRAKSPREIRYIGHRVIAEQLRPGVSELELFGEVTRAMMAAGGEFPALIPIFNAVPVKDGQASQVGHGMAGRRPIQAGELLAADLCGVVNRYHANVCRGHFVGEPPTRLVDQYTLAAGAFDVIREKLAAGVTVREFNRVLRSYYEEVGLWDQDGWALGYELGLSLPPDWVGDFYFHVRDVDYLDRVFEPGMVTNFESLFGTSLIETLIWEEGGVRMPSETPLRLLYTG